MVALPIPPPARPQSWLGVKLWGLALDDDPSVKKVRKNFAKLPYIVLTHPGGSALDWAPPSKVVSDAGKDGVGHSSVSGPVSQEHIEISVRHRTRTDQPIVLYHPQGSKPRALASADVRKLAMEELERDMHAQSSQASRSSCWKTWCEFHWTAFGNGVPVLPLTQEKLLLISAMFKAGLYHSFSNYLARAKEQRVLEGHSWSQDLDRLAKNCRRSVARGLSPKKRSEPFDFDQVMGLSDRVGFFNLNILRAPFSPFAMTTFATSFLCREIELAGTLAHEVWIEGDPETLHYMRCQCQRRTQLPQARLAPWDVCVKSRASALYIFWSGI